MTLRDAADRTSRSITTLRRYIRSGRLRAQKREGRWGPEYHVSEEDLVAAGLHPLPGAAGDADPADTVRDLAPGRPRAIAPAPADQVPLRLFQDLQMKHEQLLVQYGMVRAGGLRVMELRAELDATRHKLEQAGAQIARLERERSGIPAATARRLREAELELEGKRLEIAALKEKVRGLEMLTRNSVTSETIEKQFAEVMAQMRRVDSLSGRRDPDAPARWRRTPQGETDH